MPKNVFVMNVRAVHALQMHTCTVCLISPDSFYIVTYYIKCVKTSWTYSNSVYMIGCTVYRKIRFSEKLYIYKNVEAERGYSPPKKEGK